MATQYYIEKDDRPDHEGDPLGVYRWVDEEIIRTERFDPKAGEWVHDTSLLEATGIGGAESFWKASEKEARVGVAEIAGEEAVGAAWR